jgi:tRNA(Ile)-lysidine synthetase-like protein
MSSPAFLDDLFFFWEREGFDPSGKSFLIALSGGADSVALLELFVREVAPRWKTPLFAVHVNHRLRAEAGLDQLLAEDLCRDRGVPLHVETLDPASRRAGQSLEMWGREQRYAAFARAAARFGAPSLNLLTAHHRDDAVETFFLRLWRGTGFAGLAGIPFRRADGVTRPLLPLPRAALREWLRALGTPWREDASNLDARIARNWVRHRLLPEWRAREPDLDARVFRLTRAAASALPAWERWMAAEHPVEAVADLGGIPAGWLRAGMEAAALKACLVALGLERPAPELITELLRQAQGTGARIQARIDESSVLSEKRGILVRSRSEFRRKPRA